MPRLSRRSVVRSLVVAAALALIAAGPLNAQGSSPQRDAAFAAGPAALDALQQRLGGPLEILRVVVSSDSVQIDARDPRQPTHVDRYEYVEGKLEGPEPVPVGRNQRELQARLFRLAATDLARVPDLLPNAVAEVRAEDGRVQNVLVERSEHETNAGNTSWGRPMFRVHVAGPRSGGFVEFQLDGKRGRVVRW